MSFLFYLNSFRFFSGKRNWHLKVSKSWKQIMESWIPQFAFKIYWPLQKKLSNWPIDQNCQAPNYFYFVIQQIGFCLIDQLFVSVFLMKENLRGLRKNSNTKSIDVCHKRKKRATSRIIGGKEARQGKVCAYKLEWSLFQDSEMMQK